MKKLFVIYSCAKYLFMKNYYKTKYTGYDLLFVYGDPNLETNYEIDIENMTAKLKCSDFFEHLPEKTYMMLNMFKNATELQEYSHLIKMDDDTEINIIPNEFTTFLDSLDNYDYCGHRLINSDIMFHNYHFGKCMDDKLNQQPYELKTPLSWGAGYFYILSRKSVDLIYDEITENPNTLTEQLYEDMMVGTILSKNKINFIELLNNNIVTGYPRPRTSSITSQLTINTRQNYNYLSRNIISKTKKVNMNYNKNREFNTSVDENDEEQTHVEEQSPKNLNTNDNTNKKDNKTNTENKTINDVKKSFNPIIHKNTKRIINRTSIRR